MEESRGGNPLTAAVEVQVAADDEDDEDEVGMHRLAPTSPHPPPPHTPLYPRASPCIHVHPRKPPRSRPFSPPNPNPSPSPSPNLTLTLTLTLS